MINFFKNTKIGFRIILTSTFLIVATITVISSLYYQYAYNDIKRECYQHSAKITKQVGMFYNKEIKSMVGGIFALKYNTQMNDTLEEFLINKQANHGIALTNIARILSKFEQMQDFVSSVYIYTPEGDFHDFNNFKKAGFVFKDSKLFENLNRMESSDLYWGTAGTDEVFQNKPDVIPILMKYRIGGYSQYIYMTVNLDVKRMRAHLENTKINDDNDIIIINQFGDVLVSTDSDIITNLFADEQVIQQIILNKNENNYYNLDTSEYLITYQPFSVVPWFVVNIQSKGALLKNLNGLRNFIYIISITSILVCIVFSIFLTLAIVKPLKQVERTIYKVTNGDFNVQCSYTNENEVGRLGKSFNFMIYKIRDLIERLNITIQELEVEKKKVEEEQELKRTAELKAMQAQINPHFLYNTLAAIIWMAHSREADDICQIASGLGEFYRIALSKGREVISLGEEIKHVENYLTIQKYRYGDKLQYRFDIDEGVEEYATIKLILQPLVENAIYHGIKNKKGQGEIIISVEFVGVNKELELTVYDNGAGMDEKTLNSINRKLLSGETVESEGYGIFNVNERIKLFFGNQYGLRLESTYLVGTHAIISLPAFYAKDLKGVKQIG